jgi:hypothetical protein
MNKPNWISVIHVAKNQLGLDEETYRAVLGQAGVKSSKDIQHVDQFNVIMANLQTLGFQKAKAIRRPKWQDDWWRCSAAQRAKIEVLWANVARTPTEEALRRMVARIIHIDSPAWISPAQASKVIVALRAMAVQAGLDPDAAERPQPTGGPPGGVP